MGKGSSGIKQPVTGHWTKVRVGGWGVQTGGQGTWHGRRRAPSFLIMTEACRPSRTQGTQVGVKSSYVAFRGAAVHASQHLFIAESLKPSTVQESSSNFSLRWFGRLGGG